METYAKYHVQTVIWYTRLPETWEEKHKNYLHFVDQGGLLSSMRNVLRTSVLPAKSFWAPHEDSARH